MNKKVGLGLLLAGLLFMGYQILIGVSLYKLQERPAGTALVKQIVTSGQLQAIGVPSSSFANALVPTQNGLYDLGEPSKTWRNLYISGSLGASTTSFSGNLLPDINNTRNIGVFGTAWRTLFASTSLNVSSGATSATLSSNGNLTLTGSILPASNNASDLGAYGTAWRNVFVSGSFQWGDSGATSASSTLSANGSITLGGNNPVLTFTDPSNRRMVIQGPGSVNNATVGTISGHALNIQTNNIVQATFDTNGNFYAGSNSGGDLGIFGNAWKDVYASGSFRTGSGTASSTISSSGNILLTGNVLSALNNTSNLGTTGTAFQSIYASTTLYVGGRLATTTVNLGTAGGSGRGTCLVLSNAAGTRFYLSVTDTPSSANPAGSIAISQSSCE